MHPVFAGKQLVDERTTNETCVCYRREILFSRTINGYSLCFECACFIQRIYNCFESPVKPVTCGSDGVSILEISLLLFLFSSKNCFDNKSALRGATKLVLFALVRRNYLINHGVKSAQIYAQSSPRANLFFSTLLLTKHNHLPSSVKYLLGTLHICVIRFSSSSIVNSYMSLVFSLHNFSLLRDFCFIPLLTCPAYSGLKSGLNI